MSATGKTTLGKALSRKMKLPFLDKDLLSDPLTNFILKDKFKSTDRSLDYYKNNLRSIEYNILFDQIKIQASLGIGSVAVSPFSEEFVCSNFLKNFSKEINKIDSKMTLIPILLYLDEATAKERIFNRNRPEDQGKLQDFSVFFNNYQNKIYSDEIKLKINNLDIVESLKIIEDFLKKAA